MRWCYFHSQHYDYVPTQFAPAVAEGRKEDDIKKRLEDAKLYELSTTSATTRAFSFSELVWTPPMVAFDTPCRDDPNPFHLVAQPNEHITRIDLISRLWDGRDVIGGLKIYVASPGCDPVWHCFGLAEEDDIAVHTVQLGTGEHITQVSGNSGWLIDLLRFHSSKGKQFGPFGGGGGSQQELILRLGWFHDLQCQKLSLYL